MLRRSLVVLALLVLTACAAEKAPTFVKKGVAVGCVEDTSAIRDAQERYRVVAGGGASYATMEQLVPGFLAEASTLHRITDVGPTYKIRVADARCGDTSDVADANLVDDAHPGNR